MRLSPSASFQHTSFRQSVWLFGLALLTLLLIGYGLLFFQLRQLQMNEAQTLLNNIVEEINHKIDQKDNNFEDILRRQSTVLTHYSFIVFTPSGESVVLSNTPKSEGVTLPTWHVGTGESDSLHYTPFGIEAWYTLHNRHQLYVDIRTNSWLSWIYFFSHPIYLLPILMFFISIAIYSILLKQKSLMWRQLINYCQDLQTHVIDGYRPLPISAKKFDADAAQIGQALNRLGYQLNAYFHTIHNLNNRQQILTDNAPVPLFLLDRQGQIIYFNQHFSTVFLTPFREDTVYMLTDFVAGNDKSTQHKLLSLAENQSALTLTVTDIQLNQHFNLRLNPLYSRSGILQGFSGVLEIVDYYHTQLQEAWLTNKQQQEKLASFDKLWAVLGHELRTPLSGIIGMLDLLNEDKENLTADQMDILSTLQQSGNTMLQLLNDMLDMAKMDAGKLQLNFGTTDILKLSRQVCALMIGNARRQNIDLLYHAAPTIPRIISTDDGRLRQIILNLLSNAIKFTKQGYVALLLDTALLSDPIIQKKSVKSQQAPHWLKITIKDTGIGISPKEQQKLFAFFNQANDDISRQFGGTGLGLAISNSFAQMMGGFIHLHSEVGVGSEFQVYLPIENHKTQPVFRYNTEAYRIQLIIFAEYALSISYIEAIFAQLNLPAIVNLGIDETVVSRINHDLDPTLMPLFLIDELCYRKNPALFQQITDFNRAKKILASMQTERGLEPEILQQFDGVQQKPLNMSGLMAEIARLYDTTAPTTLTGLNANQDTMASSLQNQSVQIQFEQFLQKLTQAEKPTTPANPANQKTVLVAEDNLVNQKIAKRQLEKLGYPVIIAENGLEAITQLQQNRSKIALILMDFHMPLLDGLEATRRIRETQDSIPIIALTANESDDDKALCLSAGMDGFLSKPLTKEKLTEILQRYMI